MTLSPSCSLTTLFACFATLILFAGCDVGVVDGGPGSGPGTTPPNDIIPAVGCVDCHGSGDNSAPPNDLEGNTDRTSPGVGAHRIHLAESTLYKQIACSSCHTVPSTVDAPGHMDEDNIAELTFGELNPQGTYDQATATCQNNYCHGNGAALLGTVQWVEQTPMNCGSCHAVGRGAQPMSGSHNEHLGDGVSCADCHSTVVNEGLGIVDPTLHVNGLNEVVMPTGGTFDPAQRSCSNLACHGSERW